MPKTANTLRDILIGVAVTVCAGLLLSYIQRPARITADVLATPFTAPPSATDLAGANCSLNVLVRNNTDKPVRLVRVTADHAVAYISAVRRPLTTASTTKTADTYTIDLLDPGASRRVQVFTRFDCDLAEGFPHPGVRVFNDDGSATIRNIIPPAGLLVHVNENWTASYTLIALGCMMVIIIAFGAILDMAKTVANARNAQPPATPPTTAA